MEKATSFSYGHLGYQCQISGLYMFLWMAHFIDEVEAAYEFGTPGSCVPTSGWILDDLLILEVSGH